MAFWIVVVEGLPTQGLLESSSVLAAQQSFEMGRSLEKTQCTPEEAGHEFFPFLGQEFKSECMCEDESLDLQAFITQDPPPLTDPTILPEWVERFNDLLTDVPLSVCDECSNECSICINGTELCGFFLKNSNASSVATLENPFTLEDLLPIATLPIDELGDFVVSKMIVNEWRGDTGSCFRYAESGTIICFEAEAVLLPNMTYPLANFTSVEASIDLLDQFCTVTIDDVECDSCTIEFDEDSSRCFTFNCTNIETGAEASTCGNSSGPSDFPGELEILHYLTQPFINTTANLDFCPNTTSPTMAPTSTLEGTSGAYGWNELLVVLGMILAGTVI